ncbi:MAG: hypothetical protein ACK4YQ_03035 [Phenylobacterium sp.]|uniref:hypothetical protein n=1 Tax=Phenylobacterium sp. TaxID=1871053 RepID=UPI00391A4A54
MRCAVAACVLALLAPATASAAELPVVLSDGARWTQTIVKTRTDERDGAVKSVTVTTVLKATFHQPRGGPATLSQDLVSIGSDDAEPAELEQVQTLAKIVFPAVVEVDEALTPIRVVDWDSLRSRVVSVVEANGGDQKAVDTFRSVFDKFDERTAAGLFKELGLIGLGQGTALEVGEPQSYEDQAPNILGGPPIKTHGVFELESYDKDAGVAVVTWEQTLDRASATASIRATVEAMAQRAPPERRAEAAAALKDLTIDRKDSCRYSIDVATGLSLRTECTMTVTSGVPGRTAKRIDRWSITQSKPETL